MHTEQNVDLSKHSTMRLGGKAKYLCYADSREDLVKLVDWAKARSEQFIVIGRGSNIIWGDKGFDGLVIVDRTTGFEIINETDASVTLKIASGEDWDNVVERTVEKGLSGFEFLSLIPGTAGAGPVQNIGAYGAELSDTLISVEALDTKTLQYVELAKDECGFGYRTSRFKTTDKGRYAITSLVVVLSKSTPQPPFYETLQKYLDENQVTEYTPLSIRKAVIAIRSSKLPDPKHIANNGSFFTNPIIEKSQYEKLQARYPDIKGWLYKDKVKLAAGWLVEQAGFKGVHDKETGMATYEKQSLVLVNEHAHSTADLLKFKKKIVDKVESMFGVVLEQEPELID